jgi:hypothetical protein
MACSFAVRRNGWSSTETRLTVNSLLRGEIEIHANVTIEKTPLTRFYSNEARQSLADEECAAERVTASRQLRAEFAPSLSCHRTGRFDPKPSLGPRH